MTAQMGRLTVAWNRVSLFVRLLGSMAPGAAWATAKRIWS